MPMLKTITGHTGCAGVMDYLRKGSKDDRRKRRMGEISEADTLRVAAKGIAGYLHDGHGAEFDRALAEDFVGIPPSAQGDWARYMDDLRRAAGCDRRTGGREGKAVTYRHYVLAPDPEDGIDLDTLRAYAKEWVVKAFGPGATAAIVYHDDNANGIPHAHVVVNNTDVETGRRLQDPDPKALARSLQKIARGLGMSPLEPPAPSGVAARAARRGARRAPATHRDEHVRRAERELAERGEYSWVADIRARVKVARSVSRSEAEFRSLLASLGVEVSDNSPRAARRDWVYSLADAPTRKVSGERLGLSYGRERLQPLLRAGGARRIADAGERAIAAIARRAVEVGDLEELKTLSEAVALIESSRASCAADLDGLAAKGASPRLVEYVQQAGILPEERPAAPRTAPERSLRQAARHRQPPRDDAAPAPRRDERGREGRER